MYTAVICAGTATGHPENNKEVEFIPLIKGGVAEFYIKPMLPHVGDIDVMFQGNDQLAISLGHPPPTHVQLPAEFHDHVKVFEIIDSHLPGYVYLRFRHLLTQCSDDSNYNSIEVDESLCLSNHVDTNDEKQIHGPALFNDKSQTSQLSIDSVRYTYVVSCGRHKPPIGQHDTETTAGQTQQLLIMLSAPDVMWLRRHIVSVKTTNGWASVNGDCHFHVQTNRKD